jgi:hypothetical protein
MLSVKQKRYTRASEESKKMYSSLDINIASLALDGVGQQVD